MLGKTISIADVYENIFGKLSRKQSRILNSKAWLDLTSLARSVKNIRLDFIDNDPCKVRVSGPRYYVDFVFVISKKNEVVFYDTKRATYFYNDIEEHLKDLIKDIAEIIGYTDKSVIFLEGDVSQSTLSIDQNSFLIPR